jgi:hypothetical protein
MVKGDFFSNFVSALRAGPAAIIMLVDIAAATAVTNCTRPNATSLCAAGVLRRRPGH